MSVLLTTSVGDLVIDLHTDQCPRTCNNFLKLCKIKYYNGYLFHTVNRDSTAHTGDPTGTGTGGDSIYKFLNGEKARYFHDEISAGLDHSRTGTVAMDSGGENANRNASGFYITLCDNLDYLDCKHTVFGEIAEGFETLRRLKRVVVDANGRPLKTFESNTRIYSMIPLVISRGLLSLYPLIRPKENRKKRWKLKIEAKKSGIQTGVRKKKKKKRLRS